MNLIFVNLKRFDVPSRLGGICPVTDPLAWISDIIHQSITAGLGERDDMLLSYLVPEALLPAARNALLTAPQEKRVNLSVGCQSVFREDVKPGGNFGAFTSNFPAASAEALGAQWSIIGHSEERRDKLELVGAGCANKGDAEAIVDGIINREAVCALERGINVLFCVGETAEQRGEGDFSMQQPRIESTLRGQIERGLAGLGQLLRSQSANQAAADGPQLVIGYEPIWAIGPGKVPPAAKYIEFVASFLKWSTADLYGLEVPVVYGGGLKEENAAEVASVQSVDGGLVALTRFTPPIGFHVEDLVTIVELFLASKAGR